MGKPGKKASNIFQNPGIKNNSDVKLPMLTALGSPLKYGKSPLKKPLVGDQHKLPKEIKDKILASPAKMGHKESPAKKGCYKK